MSEKKLDTIIILRNDTAANWITANPILKRGEYGVEIDTRQSKVGNGTSAWKDLNYTGLLFENIPIANATTKGFISSDDWKKIQTVAENSTKVEKSTVNGNILINGVETKVYTLPVELPATIIKQDATHRFITDVERKSMEDNLFYTNADTLQIPIGDFINGDTFDDTPVNEILTKLLYPKTIKSIIKTFRMGDTALGNNSPYVITYVDENNVVYCFLDYMIGATKPQTLSLNASGILNSYRGTSFSLKHKKSNEILETQTLEFFTNTQNKNEFSLSKTISINPSIDFWETTYLIENDFTCTAIINTSYPIYYGTLPASTIVPTSSQIKQFEPYKLSKKTNAMLALVSNNKERITEISMNNAFTNERICVASPTDGIAITNIIDNNGYDITNNFTKHIVNVTGLDGIAVPYNVFLSEPTSLNNPSTLNHDGNKITFILNR